MGFFSWKTSDTGESIPSRHSARDPVKVKMLDHQGNEWFEDNYEGYGDFGGMDYYALLADMNGRGPDRDIGIRLAFGIEKPKKPKLVTAGCKKGYSDLPDSEICENQGYFY